MFSRRMQDEHQNIIFEKPTPNRCQDLTAELQRARDYINSIDFSMVIAKLVCQFGWKLRHAEQCCHLFRNYLFLCKKYGNDYQLPPSEDIDEFWHQFILDTRPYQRHCLSIFGFYLEHYPYLGVDDKTNLADLNHAFANTLRLYEKEFNEPLYQIRNKWHKVMASLKQHFFPAENLTPVARKIKFLSP